MQPLQTFTSSDEIVPVQMPVVDGKPMFGYTALLTRDASQQQAHWLGDAQALRWMVLMNIAQGGCAVATSEVTASEPSQ